MGFIFYLGMDYKVRLREESATTFNIMPFLIFITIFPVFIGFFLRFLN